ncbi:ATP-binding protein [Myxococcus sp. AM010]|uniref:ATP-binding protein n=1 Tax=Myxococcus sp. AM010 TaxID=2745138 RepID=UPI001595357E|nr:ATP-binding protein [Myxococcus sp. AM010]NVJ16316.1 ATP-binding protein [Myxococcus sp. AM010]
MPTKSPSSKRKKTTATKKPSVNRINKTESNSAIEPQMPAANEYTATHLNLPVTYEEVTSLFSQESLVQKLMDFVVPLESEEEKIIQHLIRAKQSGKILFIYGEPGSGKSTFIESLSWRKHIGLRKIIHINTSTHLPPTGLTEILKVINEAAQQAAKERDLGPTALVLDYLESLDDYPDEAVKGFYRTLNGILRNAPLLILWPVVSIDDANKMIRYSEGVSGTMFTRGEELHRFSGPPIERYVSIAETTIGVSNNGRPITDFGLTRGDLEEALTKIKTRTRSDQTIRRYLELTRETWNEKSGFLKGAIAKIPKFSEVWFVICHAKAEEVVKMFARRGDTIEDAWLANHDALYEYVKGTQRAGFWNARKLQMAINGVIRTRILYIPTNCMVAAIAAYSPPNSAVRQIVLDNGGSKNWTQKHRAKKYFESTPLFRQLAGHPPLVGKRKSGPGHEAINKAEPSFSAINKWLSTERGHDSILNAAIANLIEDKLRSEFDALEVSKPHPWIPNVIPDIRIDPKDTRRHINIEFHFTNNKQPNEVADYCLKKLQIYLQQVEQHITIAN